MNSNPYPLRLPALIQAAAERLAQEDGMSLNDWIASAVAQKIDAVETAADFLKRRARGATGDDLAKVLERVPDNPPMEGDELPKGWSRTPSHRK